MFRKYANATDSMMIASRPRNAAAANSPMPTPPAFTLTFSSDLASAISPWTRLEMSRVASATRRPRVGSSLLGTSGRVLGGTAAWLMVPPSCPDPTGAKPDDIGGGGGGANTADPSLLRRHTGEHTARVTG